MIYAFCGLNSSSVMDLEDYDYVTPEMLGLGEKPEQARSTNEFKQVESKTVTADCDMLDPAIDSEDDVTPEMLGIDENFNLARRNSEFERVEMLGLGEIKRTFETKPVESKKLLDFHDAEILNANEIVNADEDDSGKVKGNEIPEFTVSDCHIVAAPLFEVCSVSIHLDDGNPFFDIYGQISLVDNDSAEEFLVFNHKSYDSVSFSRKDNIPAILQKSELHTPYRLPSGFLLKLNLIDKIRNVTIVKAETALDFCGNISYDKELELRLNEIVTVHCTVFQFAILASVKFSVIKNGEGGGESDTSDIVNGVSVRGSICASSKVRTRDKISRVLFDQELRDTFVAITAPSELLPLVELLPLALPAYSSLRLKVDLKVDSEPIVSGADLVFKPIGWLPCHKEIVGQKWSIRVSVFWTCLDGSPKETRICESMKMDDNEGSSGCYKLISSPDYLQQSEADCGKIDYPEQGPSYELVTKRDDSHGSSSDFEATLPCPFQQRETYSGSGDSDESCIEESRGKRQKLLYDQLVSGMINQRNLSVFTYYKYARNLLEVFSVSVGSFGRAGSALRLYGTIKTYDSLNMYLIFSRDEANPFVLNPHENVVPVEHPHCYETQGSSFVMSIDLKDAKGCEISKGFVAWSWYPTVSSSDEHICAVVRGKKGFAAVHYAIFERAVAAKINVTLLPDKCDDVCQVHGRICASHSSYKYSTVYDMEYYRSMLFEKGMSESVKVGSGVEVPLSKYMVAVPEGASLIVEVNLEVEGEYVETLRGEATFNPEKSTSFFVFSTIKGRKYCLLVSVEWG